MLFFTGIQRFAEKIAKTYVNDIKARERQLNLMYQMVDEGKRIINTGDLDDFGHLLDQTWQRKKELSREVSNQTIDDIYDLARKSGALGGKISGAGGGGFMFFYVPIEKQEQVKKNLSQLIHVPFKFESVGSRIIFSGE
jgi:D-glycero-alpha-D-manno-heptose-7-phosphate kinase